ncbi:MAG: J domain-containing protein [Sphingomonadaceae bacterium]|nr:J domain-containing protein [Sphingomonadaceae bacterium]
MKKDRFHGRFESQGRQCSWPGCDEPGEFRAPGIRVSGFDGPGDFRWLCLEHIRQFNAGYDYFEGMNSEEILQAQSPLHGWERETRAFRPTAGVDGAPRWADFSDPLDAIGARARAFRQRAEAVNRPQQRSDGRATSWEERRALETLGLPIDADIQTLRRRYSELVRRYHPDRNGGNRRHEGKLGEVVDAYKMLRKAAAFN